MTKVYILQKDLPDAKAGDRFIWNDGMVDVNAYYHNGNTQGSYWLAEYVKDNEEWFKPEKLYTEEDMHKCFIEGAITAIFSTKFTFEDYLKSINK